MLYTKMTKLAMKLCFEAHRDQVDKSGLPYVFHPFHLAEQMQDEATTVAALLHDVVEDGGYTMEALAAQGFDAAVLHALELLTHAPEVPYLEYVEALRRDPIAAAVKLADLRHNSDLSRLDAVDEAAVRRREKYAQAIRLLETGTVEEAAAVTAGAAAETPVATPAEAAPATKSGNENAAERVPTLAAQPAPDPSRPENEGAAERVPVAEKKPEDIPAEKKPGRKVVIVGGVAGGATAAARIRRLDEQAQILVFERSGFISYANCGLPYYVGGVIKDAQELTLQTPQSFYERFRVDVRVRHEVTALHPDRKAVTVKDLATGEEFEETYDRLLLAPGARPIRPPLPGMDSDRLFTLRTVEDTLRIHQYVQTRKPASAVLVGGGFIGVELAENLHRLGIQVTVVEMAQQLLSPFDADMAAFLHAELRKNDVGLALGCAVEGFEETDAGITVRLKGGAVIRANMVILAIGVVPDTAFAREAGLTLGAKGSIVVNDRMETSVRDVYAVGDAVQVKHAVTGQDILIPLAGPANRQARIAADNICGGDSRYRGSQGSSVLKVFELTAAATGLNEAAAARAGLRTEKVILSPMSHAGYYPGGRVMTMKVIFEKESRRLLGAQIIGYNGVDKRIDVLATALNAGMCATQLKDLELAYAPPYSSAKDPVNMAGYIADNVASGRLKQWYVEDAAALPRDGSVTLLDTRTPDEYARGHIEGFVNIPVDELRERLQELERGKPVYVICQSGLRSYIASRILEGNGFEAYNFAGGFRFYAAVMQDRRLTEKAAPCGMDQ